MKLFRCMKGSVLMEYMVVNLLIAAPVFWGWREYVYDGATDRWQEKLGLGIQQMFQRVMGGVALPVP